MQAAFGSRGADLGTIPAVAYGSAVNEFVVNAFLANEFEVDELAVNLGGERNQHSPPAVPSVLVNPQLPLPFHGEARPTRAEAGVASAAVGTVGKC